SGGAGIEANNNVVIGNLGDITGGKGAKAGSGVVASDGVVIANAGSIHGGQGSGRRSVGGAGIEADNGGTIVNLGSIAGGNGRAAGVGIAGTGGITVYNRGAISGGFVSGHVGDEAYRAHAVDFSGGGNTLKLYGGYSVDGNISSSSGTTNGGDTLQLTGNVNDTFNVNQISGPSNYFNHLEKRGSSEWTLTGEGQKNQNWDVFHGTLIGNANSLSGNIANAGKVVFNQDTNGAYGGDVGGLNGRNGVMVKEGSGALRLMGSSSLDWSVNNGKVTSSAQYFTGNVQIANLATFTFDESSDATYGGNVSGDGHLVKDGTGRLSFGGDNSGFSGDLMVNQGIVNLGSNPNAHIAGATNVGAGGLVAGSGTIGSTVINSGGILAPGNSIGHINVVGDLTMKQGTTYKLEVVRDNTDQTHVT